MQLDSSWGKLKRGFGFGVVTGRNDPRPQSLSWSDWGRWQFARMQEYRGKLGPAAEIYESLGFVRKAARLFEAGNFHGEAARLLYADYGRSGRFLHLLDAEAKLKNQLYGRNRATLKPDHKVLFASIQQEIRAVAKTEAARLTAEAEVRLADGDRSKAAALFLEASEMALQFSMQKRRELRERAEAINQTIKPAWASQTPTERSGAPEITPETEVSADTLGEGLEPSDVPSGMLTEGMAKAFFSDSNIAKRRKIAAELAALQDPADQGIVFMGDDKGATDAINNARALKARFEQNGERVLIFAGHGGPFLKGQKVMGTHLLNREGDSIAWFVDNEWGALELLDIARRAGVSLDGYEKIVFATCHGGTACGLSRAVNVPVLGTDKKGWLHYSSNLVVSPETGFNFGMFMRDEGATKEFRQGKETPFTGALP